MIHIVPPQEIFDAAQAEALDNLKAKAHDTLETLRALLGNNGANLVVETLHKQGFFDGWKARTGEL